MKLEMKYFVLKPRGTDIFAQASRHAMKAYANIVTRDPEAREFAEQVRAWAACEAELAKEVTSDSQNQGR